MEKQNDPIFGVPKPKLILPQQVKAPGNDGAYYKTTYEEVQVEGPKTLSADTCVCAKCNRVGSTMTSTMTMPAGMKVDPMNMPVRMDCCGHRTTLALHIAFNEKRLEDHVKEETPLRSREDIHRPGWQSSEDNLDEEGLGRNHDRATDSDEERPQLP